MNDQSKLFRRLELVTSLFIFLSLLSVCTIITYHFYKTEEQKRNLMKKSVEDYILQSKTEIAEAMYFNLGEDLKLREKAIQLTVGNSALVSIDRIGVKNGEVKKLNWNSSTSTASKIITPVYFGSIYIGSILVTLKWDSKKMLMTGGLGIYAFLSLAIAFSLLLWFVIFGQLKKRYLVPLMEKTMERERVIATIDTAKMLAHDVKRPFNLLYSFLQSLEYVDDITKIKERIDRTLPKAKKASDTLQELIDTTMNNEVLREFTLDEVCESAICQLGEAATVRLTDIDIELSFQSTIRGNKAEYVRVFQNILSNSIEATKKGDKIRVFTICKSGLLQIRFSNEGPEMTEQVINKVFKSGFSSKKGNGRGEGLSSVKRIVTNMGGSISAKSKDCITMFTIELPMINVNQA